MSFVDAQLEVRGRFTEVLQLINQHDAGREGRLVPSTPPDKALRGLVLVAIYSAVERGVNAYVEQALQEATSNSSRVRDCTPQVQAIFHYPLAQSVRNCSDANFLGKSSELFKHILQDSVFSVQSNPLASRLQNVDGSTMEMCCEIMGVPGYTIGMMEKGRLNNLRERRNAVAHGRESSVQVGGRFEYNEIRKLHEIADTEVERFGNILKEYFETRSYELRIA